MNGPPVLHRPVSSAALHSPGPARRERTATSRRLDVDGRIGRPGTETDMSLQHLSRRPRRLRRADQRGITTAEYAVGTAAGAGLAGLLYKLLTGGFGDKLLKTLFDHVLGLLGIG